MTATTPMHAQIDAQLEFWGKLYGATRGESEDRDNFAMRLHHQIDTLIREHATKIDAQDILTLMDLHDLIEGIMSATEGDDDERRP